jgi:multiple sugar transport system ATP-binding protein
MSRGVVQQCASALDIYHHPTNRFVAGFLGTPPMNFFEGRLVDEGGRLWFDEGTARLPVPARAASALRARATESPGVVLGVRPEALAPESAARFATAASTLPMKVWLVQPLGATMDVYLQTERHARIIAHVDASADGAAPAVGDSLPIAVDMERAHFFAPGEDGNALA